MSNVLQFLLCGAIVGALLAGFVLGKLSKPAEVVEVNGPYKTLYFDLLDKYGANKLDYDCLVEQYKAVFNRSTKETKLIESLFAHINQAEEIIGYARNEKQVHNILLAFYTAMLDEKVRYRVDKP